MPAPSVTYTFSNGTTADATQVNQNFTDLINGLSDGTKDLTISALTAGGTVTCNGDVTLGNASGDTITVNGTTTFAAAASFNGNVTLGNASSDDITVTGSIASTIPIKTNTTYDLGSSTKGLQYLYLGGTSTFTGRIGSAALSDNRLWTIPETGADASFVMTAATQTVGGAKTFSALATFSSGIAFANETLDTYDEGTHSLVYSAGDGIFSAEQTSSCKYVKIGKLVMLQVGGVTASADGTPAAAGTNSVASRLPAAIRPGSTNVRVSIPVTSGGSDLTAMGVCRIDSDGDVNFFVSANYTTNWGSAGNNGWPEFTVCYTTA